jgi:hypothetical protein
MNICAHLFSHCIMAGVTALSELLLLSIYMIQDALLHLCLCVFVSFCIIYLWAVE